MSSAKENEKSETSTSATGNGSIFSSKRSYPFCSIRPEEYIANKENLLKLWYKEPNRVDLGECLLAGVVESIPRSIHPNHLTIVSLGCNIVLFALALMVPLTEDRYYKAILCVVCSIFTFLGMALDALDGMHARATQQTSYVGALLDHWFDSLSSVMCAASIALGLDCNNWLINLATAGPLVVYNTQLLIYHHQHAFPRLSGVESQLCLIAAFIVSALFYVFEIEWLKNYFGATLGLFETIGCIYFIFHFGKRYTKIMWLQFSLCVATAAAACALHQWQYLCTFEFMVFCVVASNRFNGDLVLYTEANLHLKWPEYLLILGCFCTYVENSFVRTYVVAIMNSLLSSFLTEKQLSKDILFYIHPTAWLFIVICFGKGIFEFLRVLQRVRDIDKNKNKKK